MLAPGFVRRCPLLPLRLELPGGEELSHRQGEVLGVRTELGVDLLDAQPGVLRDEAHELVHQLLNVGLGTLDARGLDLFGHGLPDKLSHRARKPKRENAGFYSSSAYTETQRLNAARFMKSQPAFQL